MTSKKPGETWLGHTSPKVKTRYNKANYETISFRLRRNGEDKLCGDDIRAAAADAGQSVNAWIIEAIRARLAGGDKE